MDKNHHNIYLDYAASTPLDPKVLEVVNITMAQVYGNASSIHRFGLQAKAVLDTARTTVAESLNARPDEIYFTSGGTESNNLAMQGVASQFSKPGNIIISAIEHPSILQTARYLKSRGWQITLLPVNRMGQIDPEILQQSINSATRLVSIMHVNNEIGSINNIEACAKIAYEKNILFHTDAVQSFGKLPVDLRRVPASFLSLTGHKIYGPKGAGVLFIRRKTKLGKLFFGGSQENGRRSGTENIPAIAGLTKAVELCQINRDADKSHLEQLGSELRELMKLQLPEARLNGGENGVPNIQNYSIPGIDNMSLLMGLDLAGIAISNGSACSSGDVSPSHVLRALHLPDKELKSSFRISFGRFTTSEDIKHAVRSIARFIKKKQPGRQ